MNIKNLIYFFFVISCPKFAFSNQCIHLFSDHTQTLEIGSYSDLLTLTTNCVSIYGKVLALLPNDRSFKQAVSDKFMSDFRHVARRVRSFEITSDSIRDELIVPIADLIGRIHDAKTPLEKIFAQVEMAVVWPEIILKLNKAIHTLRLSNISPNSTTSSNVKLLNTIQILSDIWGASSSYRIDSSFINHLAQNLDRASKTVDQTFLDELGVNYLRVIVKAMQIQLTPAPPRSMPGAIGKDIS